MKAMQKIKEFFFCLSDTDLDIIGNTQMTKTAISRQISYGIFVFLVMMLAFISGQEAARTFFYEYNGKDVIISTFNTVISTCIGLFYACFIGMIDRAIVSSTNKKMSYLRIPLAIGIAIVIAIPLEMRALKNDIEAHIIQQNLEANHQTVKRKDDALLELNNDLSLLKQRRDQERQEISKWSRIMEEENKGTGATGIEGRGPAYDEAKRNLDLHEELLRDYELDYRFALEKYENKKNEILSNYRESFEAGSFSFGRRYDALNKMKDESPAINQVAVGLMMFLLLLELTPALIKVMSNSTAYDQLILVRDALNEQSINTQGNQLIQQVGVNPSAAATAGQAFQNIKKSVTS